MNRKITPFQKISALTLIIALIAMTISPAFASTNLVYSNPSAGHNTDYAVGTPANVAFGKAFTGDGNYLFSATFYLENNTATNTGNVYAALYNTTGGEPPAGQEPIENSTNVYNVAGLTAHTFVTFTFSNTSKLTFGQGYGVVLTFDVALAETIDIASSTAGSNFYRTTANGSWEIGNISPILSVYSESTYGGGTPPSDDPGLGDWTTYDQMIDSFVSFIVPLVVLLLPAMLLMFLTRRTDKWLLIIGIAIGAGLGYYFGMVPLWLVFLVTIGLIGMAYQSVRGGGDS